jgi:site-specific recombinase XerD
MIARASTCLSALVQSFFGAHLPYERKLSPRTVSSYADALRLFLDFAQTRTHKQMAAIALSDFTPELIRAFLDHLEYERHNSVHSRNVRLAALRAFLKFAALWDASPLRAIEQALAVPMKRFKRPRAGFISREQALAIVGSSDGSWLGRRDHVLLSLLYNTAATVSEIVRLQVGDLVLDGAACVCFRSTRRARSVPLWPATVALLRSWLELNPQFGPESIMVPNQRGQAMTATCVRRRLALAVSKAAARYPELARRRISPRSIRHSAAMHLLQSGTDLNLITRWLGHDTPATMHNHARAYQRSKDRGVTRLLPQVGM